MYHLIRDSETFNQVSLDPSLPVFTDLETTVDEGYSDGGLYGKIRLAQFCQPGWTQAVVTDCYFVPLEEVLSLLKPNFLIFHNASFDMHTINRKTTDSWLPSKLGDTLYASRLKWYTKQRFGFYECLEYAGLNDELIESINKKEEQKSNWSGPLTEKQKVYAAVDVLYLAKLWEYVKTLTDTTIYKLDIQSLELAIDYTRNGMPINQDTVSKLKKKYLVELEDSLDKLPLNPRSYTKVAQWLGTSSSDHSTLTRLIHKGDEKAQLVRTARHCYKSLEYLNKYDRPVIRGFFNPSAALAGRFSCTGGDCFSYCNLQQIPQELHDVVEAPEEWEIIYKDYSGLELRMAVAYTGEPLMAALMKAGEDLHTASGQSIYSKEVVTDEERTVGKTCNFTLIYGGGVKTLRDTLIDDANMYLEYNQVKDIREQWFDTYTYFQEWHSIFKHQMNVYGYVDIETALGRKIRSYKLTDALNQPIQGSSVEVTKVSVALLYERHPELKNSKGARFINVIHDANLILSPKDEAEYWGNELDKAMCDAWYYVIQDLADPGIPMKKGFEHGPIWIFH